MILCPPYFTKVAAVTSVINMCPEAFAPDPEAFRPERFIRKNGRFQVGQDLNF